jgi:hypothetical protein
MGHQVCGPLDETFSESVGEPVRGWCSGAASLDGCAAEAINSLCCRDI